MEKNYRKDNLKNHFAYRFWVYAAILIIGWFVADLAYTVTEYRPPNHRKVEFELVGPGFADTVKLDQAIGPKVLAAGQAFDPTLEAVSYIAVPYSGDDQTDVYGNMKHTVLMAAGEGNVWVIPRDLLDKFHAGGGLMPLDELVDEGLVDTEGMDLTGCWLPEPSKQTDAEGMPLPPDGPIRLYALPAGGLKGLEEIGYLDPDSYFVLMNYCANPQTSMVAIDQTIKCLKDGLPGIQEEEAS